MNDTNEQRRLACPPVNDPDVKVTALEGSVEGACDKCGTKVWVGPKQLKVIEEHPETQKYCFRCIVKEAEADPSILKHIKALGAEGHAYEFPEGDHPGGKYGPEAEWMVEELKADAVIIIVGGGIRGDGMSVCARNSEVRFKIPGVLRETADNIEKQNNS